MSDRFLGDMDDRFFRDMDDRFFGDMGDRFFGDKWAIAFFGIDGIRVSLGFNLID